MTLIKEVQITKCDICDTELKFNSLYNNQPYPWYSDWKIDIDICDKCTVKVAREIFKTYTKEQMDIIVTDYKKANDFNIMLM